MSATCVGRISHIFARQGECDPGINCTKSGFTLLNSLAQTGDIFYEPQNFEQTKIGWNGQPSLVDKIIMLLLEPLANVFCSGVAPHDCIITGLTSLSVPADHGLSLVAKTQTQDLLNCKAFMAFHSAHDCRDSLLHWIVDLHRVMLQPTLLLTDLLMWDNLLVDKCPIEQE